MTLVFTRTEGPTAPRDRKGASLWYDRANCRPTEETALVTVKGKEYTNQQCLVEALLCDARYTRAWNALGCSLPSTGTIFIDGKEYTKQECFAEAVSWKPTSGMLWANLGQSLGAGRTVVVPDLEYCDGHRYRVFSNRKYTAAQCYLKALLCDPDDGDLWYRLAVTMPSSQIISISRKHRINSLFSSISTKQYAKHQCYAEAVRHNALNGDAWFGLAALTRSDATVTVNGKVYTKLQCYLEALQAVLYDHSDRDVWVGLAASMTDDQTVTVDEERYTKRDCYQQALRCDPSYDFTHSYEWIFLGHLVCQVDGTVTVNDKEYTKEGCFVEAFRCNTKASWCHLGKLLRDHETVTMQGNSYTQLQCYLEAVKSDSKDSSVWRKVANAMIPEDIVTVNGKDYTPIDCFMESLRCDPTNAVAWGELGMSLADDQQVVVNDKLYDRYACNQEALRHDPQNAAAWYNIASIIPWCNYAIVNGKHCFKDECYRQSLRRDPDNYRAWLGLAFGSRDKLDDDDDRKAGRDSDDDDCSEGDSEKIDGRYYTKVDCFVQALRCKPCCARAWRKLGDAMDPYLSQWVNGKTYRKRECFLQAIGYGSSSAQQGLNQCMDPGEILYWKRPGSNPSLFRRSEDVDRVERVPIDPPIDSASLAPTSFADTIRILECSLP